MVQTKILKEGFESLKDKKARLNAKLVINLKQNTE